MFGIFKKNREPKLDDILEIISDEINHISKAIMPKEGQVVHGRVYGLFGIKREFIGLVTSCSEFSIKRSPDEALGLDVTRIRLKVYVGPECGTIEVNLHSIDRIEDNDNKEKFYIRDINDEDEKDA